MTHKPSLPDVMVIPLILLLSVPPLIWFSYHWTVTVDAGRYLINSWHLLSGQKYSIEDGLGYAAVKRGPGFPAFIGLLTLIFGHDTKQLAWVIRLLVLINPLLIYMLVKRISGSAAGLLAASLVALLSYISINPDAFNIDAMFLTMYFLTLLVMLAAVRTNNSLLAFGSGLLFGSALLVKETMLANLPFAVFLALVLGWNLRRVLLHYIGVAIVCLPWWVWVYLASGQVFLAGRISDSLLPAIVAAIIVFGSILGAYALGAFHWVLGDEYRRRWTRWAMVAGWVLVLFGLLISTLPLARFSIAAERSYLTGQLAPSFILWPLFVIAAGYVVWRALRLEPLWELLGAALLFQVPICLVMLIERWDPRQYLVLETLLLCVLAILIVDIATAAVQRRREYFGWLRGALVTSLAIFIAVAATERSITLLSDNPATPAVGGARSQQDQRMIRWMSKNVPPGEMVLTTRSQAAYLEFLDRGRHRWSELKMDQGKCIRSGGPCVPDEQRDAVSKLPSSTIWLDMRAGGHPVSLSISGLQKQLRQNNSKYVMMTASSDLPHISRLALRLNRTQDFQVEHVVFVRSKGDVMRRSLILLKATGQTLKEPIAVQMDPPSVLSLERHEKERGAGYEERMRSRFPHGILLVASSNEEHNRKAIEVIESVYPSQGQNS